MKTRILFNLSCQFISLLLCFNVLHAQNWSNQIEKMTPADNAFYTGQSDSILIEFRDPVETLSQNLYLYKHDGFLLQSIPLNGSKVQLWGDTLLSVHPDITFNDHWSYYIEIDPNAFGPGYPGINNQYEWNFTPGFYMREKFYSDSIGDDYMILIGVPEDYNPSRENPYPALYFTDGNSARNIQMINGFYEEGQSEPAISIGIGYLAGESDNRYRDMILCPNADRFLAFIRDELIPHIESDYHIDQDNRTLCGYSLGGSFSFYVFCKYTEEKNRLFRNFVCGDPSLWETDCNDKTFVEYEQELNNHTDSLGMNMFLTASESQGNRQYVEPMMETLWNRNYKNFGLYTWIIPGTNHNSASGPSMQEGMLWALTNPEEDFDHGPPAEVIEKPYLPLAEAIPDTIIDTKAEALDMVEQCYNVQKLALFGFEYQLAYHGLDDRLKSEINQYDIFKLRGSEDQIVNMYNRVFAGLNICNKAIVTLPHAPISDSLKSRAIAEAKFSRALLSFYAYNMFQNFPAPNTVVDFQENEKLFNLITERFPSNKRTYLKEQILNDLNEAANHLPISYPDSEKYRATKGAALTLLGKFMLFNNNWQDAADAFQQVMDMGIYELSEPQGNDSADYVNAYLCNFSEKDLMNGENLYPAEFNNESIYEINFYDCGSSFENEWLPGWTTQGSLYASYFAPHGWHNIVPTAEFINQFENTPGHPAGIKYDPRLYATVFKEGDLLDNRPGTEFYQVPFDPETHSISWLQEGYGLRKYCYPLHYNPWHVWNENGDNNNWRVFRYADVLLMYAEALWHIGGSDNLEMGLNYLNQVRSRAGLPELLSLTPEAIMHERDVELGAEAIRFMDLIRWSKLNEPWFQLSDLENFNTGEDEFLPVLPREINFSTRRIEDGAIDSLGFFEIKHVLNYGNFTYSLIQGDGINDADNDKFYITDNILYAQAPLVYKNQPEYKILIEATDMQGETREQAFTLKLKSSTPVHEISKNEIKVFPNPVINDLNLLNASDQSAYKIYNLQGKLVKEGLFFKNTKINVHNLKSGLYILEMHTMEGYYATKFIKK